MPFFMNPFKKHDVSDFPGVFVELRDAHRHPSVVDWHDKKSGLKETGEAEQNGEEQYSPYTIEALKAEVDEAMSAGMHDTAYDRV